MVQLSFFVRSQNYENRLLDPSFLPAFPSFCPDGTTRLLLDEYVWNLISTILLKSAETNQVLLKPDKNSEHLTRRPPHIDEKISLNSSLNEKPLGRYCRENQNTHFVLDTVFRKPCGFGDKTTNSFRTRHATGDNIMRLMRFAFWITKAKGTHSEYVTFLAFHAKNNYANAFQCCVIRTLSC
jgi:hypothetical protein